MFDGYNAVHESLNDSEEQELEIKKRTGSYRKIKLIPLSYG
jgi:hypothetical protein